MGLAGLGQGLRICSVVTRALRRVHIMDAPGVAALMGRWAHGARPACKREAWHTKIPNPGDGALADSYACTYALMRSHGGKLYSRCTFGPPL